MAKSKSNKTEKNSTSKTNKVQYAEFHGKPTIGLPTGNQFKPFFSFGTGKAKLILSHLADIKAFVRKNDTSDDD